MAEKAILHQMFTNEESILKGSKEGGKKSKCAEIRVNKKPRDGG